MIVKVRDACENILVEISGVSLCERHTMVMRRTISHIISIGAA